VRILFLTSRPYLPQKIGGVESNTHETILELKARGHFCAVLSGLAPENSLLTIKNRIKFKVLNQKSPVDHNMGYPVARVWNVLSALEEAKKQFSPDIAILLPSDGKAAALSFSLARLGIKSVLHLHDVEFGELGDPHHMCLSGIFACSGFTRSSFEKKFKLQTKVSLNIFRRENYECVPTGRNVTFINPVDVKGRDIAIELARRNPRVPFMFVEGWQLRPDDRERLFKTISRLPNIEWHNPVSDMRRILQVDPHPLGSESMGRSMGESFKRGPDIRYPGVGQRHWWVARVGW
jgi:hypothetical protein